MLSKCKNTIPLYLLDLIILGGRVILCAFAIFCVWNFCKEAPIWAVYGMGFIFALFLNEKVLS